MFTDLILQKIIKNSVEEFPSPSPNCNMLKLLALSTPGSVLSSLFGDPPKICLLSYYEI